MASVIIKTVRRECGRVERILRREHPEVVWLLTPGIERALSGEVDAAMNALTDTASAALNTLHRTRDIRRRLRDEFDFPTPDETLCFDRFASAEVDGLRFASPEIDRLRALHTGALTRFHDGERQRGHQLLADVESGAEWQRHQEHIASFEKWRRDGPFASHSS